MDWLGGDRDAHIYRAWSALALSDSAFSNMATGYPEGTKDFTRFLGPGVGYGKCRCVSHFRLLIGTGVVVGIGAFFAVLMSM